MFLSTQEGLHFISPFERLTALAGLHREQAAQDFAELKAEQNKGHTNAPGHFTFDALRAQDHTEDHAVVAPDSLFGFPAYGTQAITFILPSGERLYFRKDGSFAGLQRFRNKR